MTAEPVAPFDVCGDLPRGTTVLEASAGTGKTFAIAALATRYVAEGRAELSQLMLVTFSRAATQELRERVRERLVSAERGLADAAGARSDGTDDLLRLLASVPDEEAAIRRQRLTRALAGFDAATIATTHGFCQQMLSGLGTAGDMAADATFVERVDDLVDEVVDDLYLRKFVGDQTEPRMGYRCARTVARQAMADRQAQLVPADAQEGSEAQQRYGLAGAVRREVAARKRRRRLYDYDDLLTRLRDALTDPVRGAAARQRLRSRYRVVLVDEFQDTDPVQWEILRAAFHDPPPHDGGHGDPDGDLRTLVLIGDPKQAVYSFRGADLVTYLEAARAAATQLTLDRNWRSDEHLVDALASMFHGAAMGDPAIVVRPVEAVQAGRRLTGAGAPVRLRVATREQLGAEPECLPRVHRARPLVAADLAADVVSLLSGGARLAVDGPARPLRPGDIAVLVRTNRQALLISAALAAANVPAVMSGSSSVFLSRMAREWLTVLRAVEQPHRSGLVRAAALTGFLGWTAEELATGAEPDQDRLSSQLRGWRDVLALRGVAALGEVMTSAGGLFERLLATPGGPRDLTDTRHIGEALHAAAVEGHLGPSALVEWLQRRIDEAAEDPAEVRSRRLETDAGAVQLVTIHGSKGLEFPVVLVPFGWDRYDPPTPEPLRAHDSHGNRLLYVGGSAGPGYPGYRTEHKADESGEELRLLYVAVTRAQCQVVVWWLPSTTTCTAPVHRLVMGDFPVGGTPPGYVDVPSDEEAWRRLETLAATSAGTIAVERAAGPAAAGEAAARWDPPVRTTSALSAAVFARGLDSGWRRTSYSALTAVLHDVARLPGVASEPEVAGRQDEPVLPPSAAASAEVDGAGRAAGDEWLRDVRSPMADLPAGTAFGTLVHTVLETVDTGAADLDAELRTRCEEAVAGRAGSRVDPGELAAALRPVLETPLGPVGGDLRLRDVAPVDRLAELDFELPLAGGDDPGTADATLADVAGLLRRHLSPDDPLASYAAALDVPELRYERLRGYLAGSIDAVLRLPAGGRAGGSRRYVVVDYKTNWLGAGPPGGEELTAWDYRSSALTAAMLAAHYPLQALLYSVALHRFLRWRQPGYDPHRHLGGVLYLFVRGMCGPATPVVDGMTCGVFPWRPPGALVEDVSGLLDRGVR